MKYLLLIHPNRSRLSRLSCAEQDQLVHEYARVAATPGVSDYQLLRAADTATTVCVQDGETKVLDQPVGDPENSVAGYIVYQADDLDAALDFAAQVPAARMGGAVEVRPII